MTSVAGPYPLALSDSDNVLPEPDGTEETLCFRRFGQFLDFICYHYRKLLLSVEFVAPVSHNLIAASSGYCGFQGHSPLFSINLFDRSLRCDGREGHSSAYSPGCKSSCSG